MIKIIHGDNIAASRSRFTALKQASPAPLSIRGGMFTFTDLTQIFQGSGLFMETKDVFVEDFFAKVKKGDELKLFTNYLTKQAQNNTIVLWEGKIVTKTQLNMLPEASSELFKLPTQLFTLLDALKPNNASFLISQAQKVMTEAGDEILLSMITRQIRILLALRENAAIEEVKKLAPWQKTKLIQQAASFTTEQLISLHSELFHIDISRKTGTNTMPLPASIDFFLLRI